MMPTALLALALQLSRWPASTPLTVDGRLEEPFWQTIPAMTEFYQVLPEAEAPAVATRVALAWDDRYLYVGAVMQDLPGTTRQSHVSRRDHIPASDDRVEWNASFSQEKLLSQGTWNDHDPILINQVARHLLVIPIHTRFSLRMIRQEQKTERVDAAREWTKIDSFNLSYENPETLTLHAGATQVRSDRETQRDYYLKVSARIP